MVDRIINDFKEPFEPTDMTAYEKYKVLQPILGEATNTYFKYLDEPRTESGDREIRQTLTRLFTQAAKENGLTTEQVRRMFMAYNSLGMPGLLAPIPLSASRVAKSFNGTWEMRHRFTNGGRTPFARNSHNTTARSQIYYDLIDPKENRLRQLTTMWTEENHYEREKLIARDMPGRSAEEQSFLLSALVDIQLTQLDEWTVRYDDRGMVFGNYGPYINGIECVSTAFMMRFGASETLIGIPDTRMILPDGSEQPVVGMFVLLNVMGGAPTALSFPMAGLPELADDLPTFDTVDSYNKMNSDKPLVGGFEPIDVYFNRLRDPVAHLRSVEETTSRFGAGMTHAFYPPSVSRLRDYQRDY
ncbi:hypothetical protein FIV00_17180 [Labrenzia sp. THAF82]|uniref:hypothetical protein n=1 Tax=Labrenzia sp. THAF82 TaxID=2587861 RepID=UPI0012689761|nr:hypothetical protein [Labrenzia sp. THAF82]QFT32227.1 hypothetical protein FIV00_17180 [Labrenzia sp. THAF82]